MSAFLGFIAFLLIAIPLLAHILVCVTTNWAAMLILGLVFFPVGWVHGAGILAGIW